MKVIIDRIQGDYAVVELEDRSTIDMPLVLLPQGAREGHVIEISINEEESASRKERIEKLCDDLWD